jgi:hypothetical protein
MKFAIKISLGVGKLLNGLTMNPDFFENFSHMS